MISENKKSLQISVNKETYSFLEAWAKDNHTSKSKIVENLIMLLMKTYLETLSERKEEK